MEIAQWHPGLESTAECCTHGQLGCSAMKLPLWRAPESSGLCENLSWVTDYVFCCLFVKPPYYLELGELTATLMGLRGWSLRNVRIREIKGKNPQPNCVCAGLSTPAEPLSYMSKAETKGAAQAFLGCGSSWTPSGITACSSEWAQELWNQIHSVMLCPGEFMAVVVWICTEEPEHNLMEMQLNCIACALKVNPISSEEDLRIPGGPCTSAYALLLRIDKCR